MRLSREKVHHLAKLIADDLAKGGIAKPLKGSNELSFRIFRIINDELKIEEVVDEEVRRILSSYKKLIDGSGEWEVLYQKHYAEEMRKKGKL